MSDFLDLAFAAHGRPYSLEFVSPIATTDFGWLTVKGESV
jgi:hypothetical protein